MVKLWQKILGRWNLLLGKDLKDDLKCNCMIIGPKPGINDRMIHLDRGGVTLDPNGDLYVWETDGYTALTAYNPCRDWNKIRDTWFGVFLRLMLIATLIRQDVLLPFWIKWRLGGDYGSFYDEFTLIYKEFPPYKY